MSRGRFGLLRLLSCGDLKLLRDVTGKLSSAIVEFVAPLRLWHSLRLPPMVGSEVSVQRTGARWRAQLRKREFKRVQESQERRERARALARRFKLSAFGHRPQAAGPIRASVRGGAPPARLLLQGIFHVTRNNFYPCIKTLIRFTHL